MVPFEIVVEDIEIIDFNEGSIIEQVSLIEGVPPTHLHPDSILQSLLHPSPEIVLLSSQFASNLFPSPQI